VQQLLAAELVIPLVRRGLQVLEAHLRAPARAPRACIGARWHVGRIACCAAALHVTWPQHANGRQCLSCYCRAIYIARRKYTHSPAPQDRHWGASTHRMHTCFQSQKHCAWTCTGRPGRVALEAHRGRGDRVLWTCLKQQPLEGGQVRVHARQRLAVAPRVAPHRPEPAAPAPRLTCCTYAGPCTAAVRPA